MAGRYCISLAGGCEVMYFPSGCLGAYVFPKWVTGGLCISLPVAGTLYISLPVGWEFMYFPGGWLGPYLFPCRVAGSLYISLAVAGRLCISLVGGWGLCISPPSGWEFMYFTSGWLGAYVFP